MDTRIVTQGGEKLTNLDLGSIRSLSEAFKESGLFPDIQKEAQAMVKIVAGQELGLPPLYSMRNFYIIKGRLAMAAETMGLLLKRTGRYNYKVLEHTDEKCSIQFYEDGEDVYLSTFTMADAKRAGLVRAESGWLKFPRAMLFSRSLSQGGRIVAPELLGRGYTIEEAESITPDTAEAIDDAPLPERQRKATSKTEGKGKDQDIDKKHSAESKSGGKDAEEKPPDEKKQTAITTTGESDSASEAVHLTEEQQKKLAQKQAAIKSLADMYSACYDDFNMEPAQVRTELNVKTNNEIVKTPWECYSQIAAVRKPKEGD